MYVKSNCMLNQIMQCLLRKFFSLFSKCNSDNIVELMNYSYVKIFNTIQVVKGHGWCVLNRKHYKTLFR